jgi:SAM-dependent methyltransferase
MQGRIPSLGELRSFRRRRIDIPVGVGDLVLDVGSGDKPHWRADILVDRFPDAEHAVQRSGSASARLTRPLFDADVTAMPFKDRAFDYVNCSHLLEHVVDPAAAITELQRVAGAGYVEVPAAGSARILDFPSHLWWCRLDDGVLVFEAKRALDFDADIAAFATTPGVADDLDALFRKHLTARLLEVPWQGRLAFRVEGAPSAELLAEVEARADQHVGRDSALVRMLTRVLTFPRRHERRDTIRMSDILPDHLVEPGDPVLTNRRYSVR